MESGCGTCMAAEKACGGPPKRSAISKSAAVEVPESLESEIGAEDGSHSEIRSSESC